MANINNIDKIKDPIIKGERPVYYLITEEKLNDLRSNGFLGSLFIVFFSISTGSAISKGNIYYFLIGLPFLFCSIYFYYRKESFIQKTKKSGEVQSLQFTENKEDKLEIIRATYGTHPNRVRDVTNKLNGEIKNDNLSIKASNDIDGDPDIGVRKSLEIEYKMGDKVINKTYQEDEIVNLP